jgi:flagellar biosynthesis/type III secretory pathway protein FliH
MTAAEEIAKEAEARGLERGRKQGREQGREQGHKQCREQERRELLVKQVTLRFAPLDEVALRLLEGATPEQLSECAELVLTATTLDELLAPCR